MTARGCGYGGLKTTDPRIGISCPADFLLCDLERINAVVPADAPIGEGCMLVLIFGVENVWVPRIFAGNWNLARRTSGEIVRIAKVQTDLVATLLRNEKIIGMDMAASHVL
jgi:hypothetical protein